MANIYEDWKKGKPPPDAVAAASPDEPAPDEENIYDKWKAGTPPLDLEHLLTERAKDVEAYRAKSAPLHAQQKEFYESLPPSMQDEYSGVQDFLDYRQATKLPDLPVPEKDLPPSGFLAQTKAGLVEDPEVRRRILASSLFPDDPESGYGRVGFDVNGDPVYVGDDNKLHKVARGLKGFGANVLANSPELVGGTLGAELGPVGAGVTAGAANWMKRQVAGAIFGEKYDPASYLKSAGINAGVAALGATQGKLLTGVADAGKLIEPTVLQNLPAMEAKRQALKAATGVDLSLPQLTDNRQLIGMHAGLARGFGPGADVIQAFDKAAKGDFVQAQQRVLDAIKAAPSTGEYAGLEGTTVAKETLRQARRAAQSRVDPTYEAAYAEAPIVVQPEVLQFFRFPQFRQAMRDGQRIAALEEKEAPTVTILRPRPAQQQPIGMQANQVPQMSVRPINEPPMPGAKPPGVGVDQNRLGVDAAPETAGTDLVEVPVKRTLPANRERVDIPGVPRRFARERTSSGVYRSKQVDMDETSVQVPDLRSLDYTKRALDDQINKLYKAGDKHEADALADQRTEFVKTLDQLAPSYPKARAQWQQELTTNIAPLERGLVGTLARFNDQHAERAAAALFDNPKLNESMVTAAKGRITQTEGGQSAWDDLVHTWVADHWDKAQTATQTSTEMNAAGRMHQAMYGSPETRAATRAMLGPEAADAMENVMQVAEGIKRTPIAGSNTARDTQMRETLGGLSGAGLRFIRAVMSPRQTLERWAENRAVQNNGLALARAFTDPAHRHELRLIMKMPASTKRNVLMLNVLGDSLVKDAASTSMGPNTNLVAGEEGAAGE